MNPLRFATYPGPTGRAVVAPFWAAEDEGYFADSGLAVSACEPPEHPWNAIANGDADIGVGYASYCLDDLGPRTLSIVALQEELRPDAGLTVLLARREPPVDGLVDEPTLAGRTIGLLPRRADDLLAYLSVLVPAGLSLADVRPIPVPHVGPDRVSMLRNGDVDIVLGRRPGLVHGEIEDGLVTLWRPAFGPAVARQARFLIVADDVLKERRAEVVTFVAAYLRGVRRWQDLVDAGDLEAMAKLTLDSVAVHRAQRQGGFPAGPQVAIDELEADFELLRSYGVVTSPRSIAAVVDEGIAVEANELQAS